MAPEAQPAASRAQSNFRFRCYRTPVIGPYDILIAGHARSRGLVVVTGNLGEFHRVEGLRAED
jgi:tRNA(fMet)-specific endonuclease VapC